MISQRRLVTRLEVIILETRKSERRIKDRIAGVDGRRGEPVKAQARQQRQPAGELCVRYGIEGEIGRCRFKVCVPADAAGLNRKGIIKYVACGRPDRQVTTVDDEVAGQKSLASFVRVAPSRNAK